MFSKFMAPLTFAAFAVSARASRTLLAERFGLAMHIPQSEECAPVTTQAGFSLDEYISKPWYVQQQQPISYLPETWNNCVTAVYEKRDTPTIWGHTIQVRNYAKEDDGTEHSTGDNLCAASVYPDPAKLQVGPCFLPRLPGVTVGPYWVLEYNEEEGYALVSGGQPTTRTADGCVGGSGTYNSGLWLFTRQRQRDQALVDKLRGLAEAQGFDVSVLKDVNQTADCPAPPN